MKKILLTLSIIGSFLILLAVLIYGGTDYNNKEQLSYFNNKINSLLKDNDYSISSVSNLTKFKWDKLCFNRLDYVYLNFSLKEKKVHTFKLNYEEYYVEENYVEGSLDQKCISYDRKILIKKKFPKHSKLVEFSEITQGE